MWGKKINDQIFIWCKVFFVLFILVLWLFSVKCHFLSPIFSLEIILSYY